MNFMKRMFIVLVPTSLGIFIISCGTPSVTQTSETTTNQSTTQNSDSYPYPLAIIHTPGPSPTRLNYEATDTIVAQTVVAAPSPIDEPATVAAMLAITPEDVVLGTPDYGSGTQLTKGLLISRQSSFMNIYWTTMWSYIDRQNTEIRLYAGYERDNPSRGVVRYVQTDRNRSAKELSSDIFYLDQGEGKMTITADTNAYVRIEAENGSIYHFMIDTLTLVKQ